ncbi:MAG TPA: glycosyltransferase family 39 protein, partial [Anaerolineae bacterium]
MNRSNWVWLCVILALSFGLRLYQIGEMSFRADEAANVVLAAQSPADIIRPFITEDPHLPLYHLILHFWMLVAGQSELAVRFVTIFAGVLTVALTYALGMTIFPKQDQIAMTGALLAAINPYLIWDAQDAYMYSLLTAITLFSLILFVRVMRTRAPVWSWIGYVAASVAGLFLHYLAGLVLLAQGVLWLVWSLTRDIPRRKTVWWLVCQLAIALLFLPWLVFALPLLSNFKSGFWVAISLPEMLQRSLVAFSVGRLDGHLMPPMVDPLTGNLFGLFFLLIFLVGLVGQNRQDRRGRVALAVYLSVPLVALYLFSMWRFPIYDERYVLFLIPAFVMVLARGLAVLRSRPYRWVSGGVFVVMLLASGLSLFNYWQVPAYAKSPDWHSFIRHLVAESRPGDVLIQNYPDPALAYYLRNRMPRILLPRTSASTPADVDTDLTRLTRKFGRVWLQPVAFGEWDNDGLVETWLNRHARLTTTSEFRGLHLSLYLPAAVALRQAAPVDATFAES